jgi:hypothetical protein
LPIQIVPVEDERLVFGVEDAPEWFLRIPALADIVDLGNVEVTYPHQVPDVAVQVQQFPASGDLFVLFLDCLIDIVDLSFQRERSRGILGGLFANQAECFETRHIGAGLG